jgi:DNA invertase Pin-like site-specific DNA recombinase
VAKAVACYVQVSTVGQNEASQRAEIERWLSGNGIDPAGVRWFIDHGKTGKNLKRPAFEQLQRAIFNGEAGTIVIYKLDRLSRSLRDGLNTLYDWCERGLRIVSVTQQLDWNGMHGKMMATLFFGLAEMEMENRKESQAAGIAEAKKEGKYKGRAKGTLKAKPERAAALRAKGLTVPEIAKSIGTSEMTVFCYLRLAKAATARSA